MTAPTGETNPSKRPEIREILSFKAFIRELNPEHEWRRAMREHGPTWQKWKNGVGPRDVNAYNRKHYLENREKFVVELRVKYWQWRKKAIEVLGGKCVVCGEPDIRVLQVNHLNGGGLKDLKLNSNSKVYRQVAKGERKDVDLRCANCNILYEYERGKRRVY